MHTHKRKKILIIGDTHCDHLNPKSRSDNYLQACKEELMECMQIARDNKCDAMVHLGDVFNTITPNYDCTNAVMRILKTDENDVEWNFRKFVAIGNHDIAHNIQNIHSSAFGCLIKGGILECVDFASEFGLGFVHFRSTHLKEMEDGFCQQSNPVIWICHSSISTQSIFGGFILFSKLPLNPECKLVISGHIHAPMDETREDGVRFINPGSVCRNALNDENRHRYPNVLMVDYDLDGNIYSVDYIPLKSSAAPEDIFRIEEVEAYKELKKHTTQFIKQCAEVNMVYDSQDVFESVRKSGEFKQIPNNVINRAVGELENVRLNKVITTEVEDGI